jgi:hypothetical protein
MRTPATTTTTALIIILAGFGCADAPTAPRTYAAEQTEQGRISFAALAPGNEIRVEMEVDGCFSSSTIRLVFRVESGVVRVTGNAERRPSPFPVVIEPLAVSTRESTLGVVELRGLDEWLAYYRAPSLRTCSASSKLDIDLYTDGKLVERERYLDATCGGPGSPASLETSFAALAWGR